jgi:hypothetical protein
LDLKGQLEVKQQYNWFVSRLNELQKTLPLFSQWKLNNTSLSLSPWLYSPV